jgi:hypothetical protein
MTSPNPDGDTTEYLLSSEANAERLKASVGQHLRGQTKHFIHMDTCGFLPPEMEIKANPTVTMDDLKDDMARIGAKQILATELNEAFSQAGVVSYFTPEMLSALAAKRLRAQQKAKKKLKKRK